MKRLIYLMPAVSLALSATAQSYIGFNEIVPKSSEGTDPKVSIAGIANGKRVTITFDSPISSELNSFAQDQSRQNAEVEYVVSPMANQANIQITSVFGEIKRIVTLDESSAKATCT